MEENKKDVPMNLAQLKGNKDWLLLSLIEITNQAGAFSDITLTCDGLIITGDMISHGRYLELFGQSCDRALHAIGVDAGISPAFMKLKETLEKNEDQNVLNDYIHLNNVKIFSPDGNCAPNGNGTLWRGKVEKISGFILGRLN